MDTQQQKYQRGVYCLDDIPKHLRKHFKPAQASWDFFGVAWNLRRVLKPGGVIVWVVADATKNGSETGTSMEQALHFKRMRLNLHDTMIWHKPGGGAVGSNAAYWQTWEYMFVLSAGRPKTVNRLQDKPNRLAGKNYGKTSAFSKNAANGTRKSTAADTFVADFGIRENVWQFQSATNDDGSAHPAPFPLSLAGDHIATWSNPGDLILDPFMGSGTTAKAAKALNRKFIGIEINPDYCAIAEQRIAQDVFDLSA